MHRKKPLSGKCRRGCSSLVVAPGPRDREDPCHRLPGGNIALRCRIDADKAIMQHILRIVRIFRERERVAENGCLCLPVKRRCFAAVAL